MPSIEACRAFLRRYVWNRSVLHAILLASPAILTTIGSFAMSSSIDREIAVLNRERDALNESIGRLDAFTRDVERYQLDRAALLLVMTAAGGDTPLRFTLDKLFRLNAQGAMRRVASVLYPADWGARMQPYEALTGQDYDTAQTVQRLQAMESAMIGDAGRRLTALQADVNAVAARVESRSALRNQIVLLGNALMYVLTILIFLLKPALK
jgi:hypothetical protein